VNLDFQESGKQEMFRVRYPLDRLQFYLPVYESNYVNAGLGNNGTAMQSLHFKPRFNGGFNWGFQTFEPYLLQLTETKFYDVQTPLTAFRFFQSSKDNIQFSALHTQNFGKAWNVGIEYQRISATGYYNRQAATHSSLRFHTWYRPKNNRYQAMLAATVSNSSCQENGGLTSFGDSLFRNNQERNRKLIPVWLDEAKNKTFQNGVLLRHSFALIAAKADSSKLSPKQPLLSLQQTFRYQFKHQSFSDLSPDSNYYLTISDPSLEFVDYNHSFAENEFALVKKSLAPDSSANMNWEAKVFLKQQYGKVWMPYSVLNNSIQQKIDNQSIGGFLNYHLSKKINLRSQTEFFYSGYNAKDFRLDGTLQIQLSKTLRLETGLATFNQKPVYQLTNFVSNFGSWNNSFRNINQIFVFGNLQFEKLGLFVQLSNRTLSNWVYMSQNRTPDQSSKVINLAVAEIRQMAAWRRWNLQSRILIQQLSGADVIRLPGIQYQESVFYESKIKSTTTFRIGADFIGCSAFRASSYSPESGLFYMQDSIKNSGLFQVDIYASFKIRRIRILLKLDHVNAGLGPHNYAVTPFYPLPDRLFVFGFSWTFFD
jgi:hypothetical protein